MRALRVSYVGEFGYELHMPMDAMQAVYQKLLEAGAPHDIGHYGLYAANSMRLEKGYRGWGSDLTTERSPIEAGLAPFCRNRDHPAWHVIDQRPNDWEMVLIEIPSDDCHPFYAHTLLQDDRPIGVITSAAYGYRTQKMLALAYLRDPAARENLQAEILGQLYPVRILTQPPFDPQNNRLRHGGQ